MDVEYELSQQLLGHGNQVRCVTILGDGTLVSGGLDAQVILWRRPTPTEGFVLHKKLSHHSDSVYAVAPSNEVQGAFYSASKDKTAVRVDTDGNPVLQFVGHEGPVCAILERGTQVVTGSWDGTAKVWDGKTGELRHSLDAGAHAVAIAILPSGDIVTGSQDKSLRVFRGAECAHRVNEAHGDIIRAFSVTSTSIVSASNDNTLKMWSFDGCEMGKLTGHQSFVYGVTHSHDNALVISTSDDCTLKMWSTSDLQCRQSIIHAGCVWQAAAFADGDVASACSDSVVRVWTREPSRMATEEERQTQKEMADQAALEAAQKGSTSQPMQDAPDISLMPSTIGKKNGEIKCFKEEGTVFAFSWNAGARCWDKLGEVVGQNTEKKIYMGDSVFPRGEYDFVFDVDMGASLGMRQLPYNRGQNPMEVAESFCSREQIHKSNIEQIRQFIIQNGGGDASAAATPAAPSAPAQTSSLFPIMTPLTFKDGKFDGLQAKILEFNDQVDEAHRLDPTEVQFLTEAIAKLRSGVMSTELRDCEQKVMLVKLAEWPSEKMFPVVDLWRLYLVHPQSSDIFKGSDRGAPFIVKVCGLLGNDISGALGMCCVRWLANLSIYQTSRYSAFDKRDFVLKALEPALSSTNKHCKVGCATVLLNYAIVLHESSQPPKTWDKDFAASVAQMALSLLDRTGPDDGDAQQRALLGIGSLLPRDKQNGGRIAAQCKERGLLAKVAAAEGKLGSSYIAELRSLLA